MFQLIHSMRAKSLLAGLVPFLLVLTAVGFVGVRAYDRVARDVVTQRDAELARVTGERLSERLEQEARLLQELAADDGIRLLDRDRVGSALDEAAPALGLFNGGMMVFSWSGITIGASPSSPERAVPLIADESSRLLRAVRATRRPAFSDVFRDPETGEDVILIGVPIRGVEEEFGGMLAGVVTLRTSLLGVAFAEVLERGGRSGLAYLVDGRGTVIYHRDLFRIGTDLSTLPPVKQVLAGETGALISDDPAGTEVVAGFAPVPGTGWGVVTQERWNLITGPIRERGLLLLAMLGVGALLSAGFGFLAIGRTLRPIRDLTDGVRGIAGGDFDRAIDTEIDHELRGLAEQFNTMAGALKDSYADLEAKVEARTEETRGLHLQAERRAEQLAAINLRTATVADVATKVASILSLDELLPYVAELVREAFSYQTVYIFLLEQPSNELVLRARAGGQGAPPPLGYHLRRGEGISGWVAEHGEPVLANDVSEDSRFMRVSTLPDTKAQLTVPIVTGDEVVGVLGMEQAEIGAFDETDLFTAETLADCLAVAIENARLFEQAGEVAVLEERNRFAREIHDTLAQGFTGIVLQLEAAEQALEDDAQPAILNDHLHRARDLARDSLNEARRSVWNLLPASLEAKPLDRVLDGEVRSFTEGGSERASFDLIGAHRPLPPGVQAALLRICQESLTNVRRHAHAVEVSVELEFSADSVRLRIRDDGTGFDAASAQAAARSAGGGLGLAGMEQRARLLNGSLTVRRDGDRGTLVEAIIPAAADAVAAR